MDKYQLLKKKLSECKSTTMGNLMLTASPYLLDAYVDFDCVLLDKEHGIYDTENLLPMLTHCRSLSLPAIVRVEDSVYHLIAKTIDMGADGIMIPRTETVEQVKTAVEAMHFHPIGRTGFGGYGLLRKGETFEEFQKGRILVLQIESRKGLENIPEMIRQYGDYIDAFMIGPNDYSIMQGLTRQPLHPEMFEEVQRVFDKCREYHKSCGCFAAESDVALRYADMGANLFWVGDDSTYIRKGIRSYLDVLPE